jgi:hypothetical protein
MTIVLQHRFWDLVVHDDRFEVKLTFNSIPERLVVPFPAIKVFFDPSVPYGLQFETTPQDGAPRRQPHLTEIVSPTDPRAAPKPVVELPLADQSLSGETTRNMPAERAGAASTTTGELSASEDEILEAEKPTAEVVSLDKFRKK